MWGAATLRTADADGHALVRFGRQGDYVVGVDNPFIRLSKALDLSARPTPPRVDAIDANLLIGLEILGTTHLIDCSSDDPANYRFLQYGNRITILDRQEYTGRRLSDADWPLVGRLAERDYAAAKQSGAATLSQIELLWHGREVVYRRLIVPLAGDRGEVTHLLVATRPNLLKVVPSSFD